MPLVVSLVSSVHTCWSCLLFSINVQSKVFQCIRCLCLLRIFLLGSVTCLTWRLLQYSHYPVIYDDSSITGTVRWLSFIIILIAHLSYHYSDSYYFSFAVIMYLHCPYLLLLLRSITLFVCSNTRHTLLARGVSGIWTNEQSIVFSNTRHTYIFTYIHWRLCLQLINLLSN